jgi:integrase
MSKRRSFGHIRQLKSKNYQASYIAPDGARHNAPHTFQTKRDASAWLALEETKISKGLWATAGSDEVRSKIPRNFKDYCLRHIKIQSTFHGNMLRKSTQDLYRRLLATKLGEFCHLDVNQIDAPMISEWWAEAIAGGKKTSSSKAYKLLKAVMNRAVGEKLIPSNPCMVRGAQTAISSKPIGVPDEDEVAQIAKNINKRYTEMVVICAYGGFRFGEVTELRRKDVRIIEYPDKRQVEITVSRAVTNTTSGFVVDKPKSTAGIRTVQISSKLTWVVERVLDRLSADPEALLFPSATGCHLRHDVFMNSWRPALKRSGLEGKNFTPHSLRHFAGTYYHRAGANIPELKAWLGDASTSAVMRYAHITDRAEKLVDMMVVALDGTGFEGLPTISDERLGRTS